MQAAGAIIEYNPMHMGHVHLLQEIRRQLGADTPVVCAMSGNFVQRGDFAIVGRRARACAAVQSGADLVLEVPLPWAVASAERFADGGVQVLLGTGLVSHVAFGSECGDADALLEAAECLLSRPFQEELRRGLKEGRSFAACRQRAAERLLGPEKAALLESPNNILGIEYCKSLLRRGSSVQPLTVPRVGAAHDEVGTEGPVASASAIRALLQAGERETALSRMTPTMRQAYEEEEAAGRAPVLRETCEDGNCLALDDGDTCACPQMISFSVRRLRRKPPFAEPCTVFSDRWSCRLKRHQPVRADSGSTLALDNVRLHTPALHRGTAFGSR